MQLSSFQQYSHQLILSSKFLKGLHLPEAVPYLPDTHVSQNFEPARNKDKELLDHTEQTKKRKGPPKREFKYELSGKIVLEIKCHHTKKFGMMMAVASNIFSSVWDTLQFSWPTFV